MRIEEALRYSEESYRRIVETANEGIWVVDAESRTTFANKKLAEMLGYTVDEMLGQPILMFMDEKYRAIVEDSIKSNLRDAHYKQHDFKYRRKDGTELWAIVSVTPIFNDDGSYAGALGMITNITGRKKIEKALRESEKRFQVFMNNSPAVAFMRDEKGRYSFVNKTWERHFNRKLADVYGKSLFELGPDTAKTYWENDQAVLSANKTMEFIETVPNPDGSMGNWLFYKFPFNNASGKRFIGAVAVDITERMRAEEELKKERDFTNAIIETAGCLILVLDPQGRVIRFNRACEQTTGYRFEEVAGKNFFDLFLAEEQAQMVKASFEKIQSGFSRYEGENYWVARDGSRRLIAWSNTTLHNEGGEVEYIVSYGVDITDRKQMEQKLQISNEELGAANEELVAINEELLSIEEELKQQYEMLQVNEAALASSNRRLQDIIEFLPDATFVIDRDKRVIAWNRAIEEMTGAPKAEMLGRGDWAYALPFYGKPYPMLIDQTLKTDGDKHMRHDVSERKNIFVQGTSYFPALYKGKGAYIWGIASPLFNRDGDLIGAIESIRDVTEQKRLEDRLKYLSLHDALTGLHNRAYFEEEMRRVGEGRNKSVGIIICDVDGLKLVNDTLGHETGDLLLMAAAGVIKNSFRESDMVARIGGDEFAVLLPNSEMKNIEDTCRRIQKAVKRHNAANPELPLSISIGFAVKYGAPANMSDLFKEADNKMYREKLHRNQRARSAIVQTLMKTLEARDFVTEEHAERLQGLVAGLAAAIDLSERSITDLRLLAQFHDIGKIGIPDSILFKPGPLTPEELMEMRQHCDIGHRIAMLAPDLAPIADWILKHHEWWDGHGYPLGLKGKEIPLECRILAIADAYDAMTSDRPYRKAMTHEEALAELVKCAGTQFDLYLVEKFVRSFT